MTAFSDETGRDWLPLKYEDGPDFCTVTLATGAAFALTVYPERMKLMEAALSACDKYRITIFGAYKDTRVSASTRITCEPWTIEKD